MSSTDRKQNSTLEIRRKRLALRAKQRSTREVNLLLSHFTLFQIPHLSENELAQAEFLLSAEDCDLYTWVLDPSQAPEEISQDLLITIKESLPLGYANTHAQQSV
jgi:antitoxin CptB